MISVSSRAQRPKAAQARWQLLPTVPEGVGLHILTGVGVALGNERHRHSQPSPFQHQVLCREARVPPVHAEGEGQVLPITQNLVAQELAWRGKKEILTVREHLRAQAAQKATLLEWPTWCNEVHGEVGVWDDRDILGLSTPLEQDFWAITLLSTPLILSWRIRQARINTLRRWRFAHTPFITLFMSQLISWALTGCRKQLCRRI